MAWLSWGYAGFGETNPNARDINIYETVMSGDIGVVNYRGDNSYHVVTGNGTNQTAVLDGFIITSGNANSPDPYSNGSGMFNNSGNTTLTNCTFSGNSSQCGGGAINNQSSRPTLIYCTFNRNAGLVRIPNCLTTNLSH